MKNTNDNGDRASVEPLDCRTPRQGRLAAGIDRIVGMRIRQRRIMLGLNQQELAELVGVTYQQQHKYERGVNRISAGRLYHMARILGVEIDDFFDGVDADGQSSIEDKRERQQLLIGLLRDFSSIRSTKLRLAITTLVRALAQQPGDDEETPENPIRRE